MPTDEVTDGTSVGESRARSGPRHAAPRKPLFTRFHMPAGKAIALAAMPTAVLMGMGFTPTLAIADDPVQEASKSLTAEEYKDCVAALEDAEIGEDASATPSPSASADDGTKDEEDSSDSGADSGSGSGSDSGSGSGSDSSDDKPADTPSSDSSDSSDSAGSSGEDSSSDSGSDDKAEPTPSETATKSPSSGGDPSTATPSPSDGGGNVLEEIGEAIKDIFTPDDEESESPAETPSPSATPSAPAAEDPADKAEDAKEAADKAAGTADDTAAKDTADKEKESGATAEDPVQEAGNEVGKAADEAAEKATASAATASPSATSTTDPDDCPTATDDEGGVEQGIPPLPDDPWYLDASSLLLKGASYEGVVKVKTANGTVKEVLKYVISDGTDIGDLHQTVQDKQAGVTHHVQAAKGSTSTIRDGDTVMYTESISGNLLGLIPVTFSPEHPPPLDIPIIYFTKVRVVQAGQFGGTLTVPGLHQYMTD
ncbi:hypothetical protein [Streptomyces sp. NPDC002845]